VRGRLGNEERSRLRLAGRRRDRSLRTSDSRIAERMHDASTSVAVASRHRSGCDMTIRAELLSRIRLTLVGLPTVGHPGQAIHKGDRRNLAAVKTCVRVVARGASVPNTRHGACTYWSADARHATERHFRSLLVH